MLFLGAQPKDIPALYSLMNYADMALGTWYPMGGMHQIIEGMEKIVRELGVEIRLNEGVPLRQAIIDAGAVRTTPILLTTGAVVIGAMIILFDPIFQGLAISLVFGAIVSTLLTLIVVPLIYYMTEKKKWEKPVPAVETTEEPSQQIPS